MSRRDLLAPVGRWTPKRKLDLIEAIRRGQVQPASAMSAHGLSAEELENWLARHARFGRAGLTTIRLQELGR